jgi:hypothetical protein
MLDDNSVYVPVIPRDGDMEVGKRKKKKEEKKKRGTLTQVQIA